MEKELIALRIRKYAKPYLSTEGKLAIERMVVLVSEAKGYKIVKYETDTMGLSRVLLPKRDSIADKVYILSGDGKWVFYTPLTTDELPDVEFSNLCGRYVMGSLDIEYKKVEKRLNTIGEYMNDLEGSLNS